MVDSVGSVLKVLLRDLAGNVAKECCEDLLYEVRDSTLAGVVICVEIVYLSGYDQGHNPVDYLTIDVGKQIVKARDFAIFGDLKGLSELLPIGGSVSDDATGSLSAPGGFGRDTIVLSLSGVGFGRVMLTAFSSTWEPASQSVSGDNVCAGYEDGFVSVGSGNLLVGCASNLFVDSDAMGYQEAGILLAINKRLVSVPGGGSNVIGATASCARGEVIVAESAEGFTVFGEILGFKNPEFEVGRETSFLSHGEAYGDGTIGAVGEGSALDNIG